MKLKEAFNKIIHEFKSNELDQNDFQGAILLANGDSYFLNSKIKKLTDIFLEKYYQNNLKNEIEVEFYDIKFQLLNIFVELLNNEGFSENDEMIKFLLKFKNKVLDYYSPEDSIELCHIPVNFYGISSGSEIKFYGVTIRDNKKWIESISLDSRFYCENSKNNLMRVLEGEINEKDLNNHESYIYNVLKNSNYMVSVNTSNINKRNSEQYSKNLARCSLDLLSLLIGDDILFNENILYEDKKSPLFFGSFVQRDGVIISPRLTQNFHPFFSIENNESIKINNVIENNKDLCNFLLKSFIDGDLFPILISKWFFALNWYSEGVREKNDAIAVAKLASCIDTLSSNGRSTGILNLMSNMLNIEQDHILYEDMFCNEVTLKNFIERFYESGRSRILHGTLVDNMESFKEVLKYLKIYARQVLYESACRLMHYKGEDNDQAFRTMKLYE